MSAALHADLIVRKIDWLITVDPARRVIRDAALGVKDGRLVNIDQETLLREVHAAAQRIAGRLDMKKMLKLRWPMQ